MRTYISVYSVLMLPYYIVVLKVFRPIILHLAFLINNNINGIFVFSASSPPSINTNIHIFITSPYLAPHMGRARYCNAHVYLFVCVFVCLFVCLSVFSQNFKV